MPMALREVKERLRAGKYTQQGGYPLYFITEDGGALSFEAVRAEWRNIVQAHLWHKNGGDPAWTLVAFVANWEDTDLICDHTGEPIESAYAVSIKQEVQI